MKSIRFTYDKLPESINKLYFVARGRKVLSAAGRKYKNDFILRRGGVSVEEFIQFTPQQNVPYVLEIWFYVVTEKLYNLTYGQDKRVKSPFAKVDTSNMIKLLEDCISELVGIKDQANFSVLAHKREAVDGVEKVVAVLRPLDLEADPYVEDR